jgi:predicted RNA-binding Zn ribbon-like protein
MSHAPAPAHEHHTDLDTALDFVNTLEHCSTRTHEDFGGLHEALRTPPDATSWLLERHLLHPDAQPAGDDWQALGRVREVRAAFRELIDATVGSRAPSTDAIAVVNDLLGSRQVPALEPTAGGVRLSHRHVAPPLDEALAGLADALVERLAAPGAERFRVCANDHCRWAFYDESRAGRRRWCDMTSCGNRAKAARHRARTKGDDEDGPPGARPA